jgi:hypothetical protein
MHPIEQSVRVELSYSREIMKRKLSLLNPKCYLTLRTYPESDEKS